jgi:hypothetical protein
MEERREEETSEFGGGRGRGRRGGKDWEDEEEAVEIAITPLKSLKRHSTRFAAAPPSSPAQGVAVGASKAAPPLAVTAAVRCAAAAARAARASGAQTLAQAPPPSALALSHGIPYSRNLTCDYVIP